jgi:hypothetical protein
MPIDVNKPSREESNINNDILSSESSIEPPLKIEGLAGSIGLSLYLQYIKYMGYIIFMVCIMFFTPLQL